MPLKKDNPLQCEAVIAVQEGSLGPPFRVSSSNLREVFELSSSVPVKRFEFEVAKATGPFLLHHYQFETQP